MPRPEVFDGFPLDLHPGYGPFAAVVDSWHDADTVAIQLDVGWDETPCRWIRLRDVHAPELHEIGGKESLDYAMEVVPPGTFVSVTSEITPVSRRQRKSFQRYSGTLELASGVLVNEAINRFLGEHPEWGGGQ